MKIVTLRALIVTHFFGSPGSLITPEVPLRIGSLKIEFPFGLSPMAGFSDPAFRAICVELGAGYTVSEMVSSKALLFKDKKSLELMKSSEKEHPFAIQLFGHEPPEMAEVSKIVCDLFAPDIIDINMGCPTPKIVSSGDGSALMKNPALAGSIISAVKRAVSVPVTVKFRKGWESDTCAEFAKMCEQSGADAICVHGRTRSEMYSGRADREAIRAAKQAVSIPVFANGDIVSAEDFLEMLKVTGCDGALIGRGALGNPYIFSRARALYFGNPPPEEPSLSERFELALRQIRLACLDKGEKSALLEARKQVSFYLKGIKGAAAYRERLNRVEKYDDLRLLVEQVMGGV